MTYSRANDYVYVTDGSDNSKVEKFNINDNLITMWRLLWYKDDEFLIPHNIMIEQNVIFI
ncbi:MAG TPA: hypothetical protein VHJ38_05995 [Nitrososphaeraceae archaeon]|jgi:hypothetical protein|nr:hypothetical protein [Nitrososphaeraceae archaeon]